MRARVSRARDAERVVTPLELFFDLVYVFAITQVSHHLLAHVDLRTGAETLILALAVFHAWYMTAWGANWLEPERLPVRLLLVGLMFASLLMSVGSRTRSTGGRGCSSRATCSCRWGALRS
jgi:low temperature requirement protein LtrA